MKIALKITENEEKTQTYTKNIRKPSKIVEKDVKNASKASKIPFKSEKVISIYIH